MQGEHRLHRWPDIRPDIATKRGSVYFKGHPAYPQLGYFKHTKPILEGQHPETVLVLHDRGFTFAVAAWHQEGRVAELSDDLVRSKPELPGPSSIGS